MEEKTIEEKTAEEKLKELYKIIGLDENGEPIKGNFLKETRGGHIIKKILIANERDYVIAYRKNTKEYIIGVGYDSTTGIWDKAYYGFSSLKEAENFVKDILS